LLLRVSLSLAIASCLKQRSTGLRMNRPEVLDLSTTQGNQVTELLTAEAAEPIRRYFKERFPPFVDDVGFDRAALVHAATEGLWFMDVLGLSPFSAKQRAQLVKTILSTVDGAPRLPVRSAARPSSA
jgi:hypothetical protein